MTERVILIHPLSVQRGNVLPIQAMLTKLGIKILAVDTYLVCLTSLRALNRDRLPEDELEDYVESFARRTSCVMLLQSNDDQRLLSILGTEKSYAPTTVIGKFRGANWLDKPDPYDTVLTTFDPQYNDTVFTALFPRSRGWLPLTEFIA